MEESKYLRILELYSGIGGMHMAAKESKIGFELVGSFEINPTAIEVYYHNFPVSVKKKTKIKKDLKNIEGSAGDTKHSPKADSKLNYSNLNNFKLRNIMGLTVEELEQLCPDIIMMSPPCQPFTRQGLKRDLEDARTSSFIHVINLIDSVSKPPKAILLENVAGFELSLTRNKLIEVLSNKNYTWQEFLLSPTQFGVPNTRLRYYLLAKLQPAELPFLRCDQVMSEIPVCICERTNNQSSNITSCSSCKKSVNNALIELLHRYHEGTNCRSGLQVPEQSSKTSVNNHTKTYADKIVALGQYLDSSQDSNCDHLLLSEKTLNKYSMLLDITTISSKRSCCFTKGYTHYVEGTGSVLQQNITVELAQIYSKAQDMDKGNPQRMTLLKELRLRYFSPNEVARLMSFPPWFQFPACTTDRQKYRVLGNSINVLAVASLLLVLVQN